MERKIVRQTKGHSILVSWFTYDNIPWVPEVLLQHAFVRGLAGRRLEIHRLVAPRVTIILNNTKILNLFLHLPEFFYAFSFHLPDQPNDNK